MYRKYANRIKQEGLSDEELRAIIREFRDYEPVFPEIKIPKGSRICYNCNGTGVLVEKKVYHHLCLNCLGKKRLNRTTRQNGKWITLQSTVACKCKTGKVPKIMKILHKCPTCNGAGYFEYVSKVTEFRDIKKLIGKVA